MNSEQVLEIFKEITKIPRESGHEEKITAWLLEFAAAHGLYSKKDEAGNVLIVKEASPGKENLPVIVLQGHTDMVCEKKPGVEHDFSRDPIKYEIEDGWMIAKDTTLGADCGIGVAAQLAALISPLETGKIECLFTVAEETGLDGAKALSSDFISGKTLINLDSEDEGELFIGCAGGLDTTAVFSYKEEKDENGLTQVKLSVRGGLGGHSGDDIEKGRANAVQLLARFLYGLADYRLCRFEGGNKRNAIARDAEAVIAVEKDAVPMLKERFEAFGEDFRAEFGSVEPELEVKFEECARRCPVYVDRAAAEALITALVAAPHGVLAMSMEIPGLVETSTNLASVKFIGDGKIRVGTSQRSSITSARKAAGDKVEAVFRLAGAEVTHGSEYPGWKPNVHSPVLEKAVAAYKRLFGVTPKVRAIHAGLECGLFLDKYPDLDMISFGPTLRGVHAPGEKLDLASLDKFVKLLSEILTE